MGNLQIKDLPENLHAELRRRAGRRGVSMRDYVLALIERDQLRLSTSEWLDELADDPPVDPVVDVAETIRRARGNRDEAILHAALDRPLPPRGQ